MAEQRKHNPFPIISGDNYNLSSFFCVQEFCVHYTSDFFLNELFQKTSFSKSSEVISVSVHISSDIGTHVTWLLSSSFNHLILIDAQTRAQTMQ